MYIGFLYMLFLMLALLRLAYSACCRRLILAAHGEQYLLRLEAEK
jgi:hypothetical protein